MSLSAVESSLKAFAADPHLLKTILGAVGNALTMCNASARCVGISAVPTREIGIVTGLIGVHGSVSGFVTVNMAERVAIRAVEGLLQDRFETLTPQVIDGTGEITNIIAGGIKSGLSGTPWAFSHVTIPSVIVGKGYQIAYAKGLEFLCTVFEYRDDETIMLDDRLMQVTVSLLRL